MTRVCLEDESRSIEVVWNQPPGELVGAPIQTFFLVWSFQEGEGLGPLPRPAKSEHRDAGLLRGDGEAVFVDYTDEGPQHFQAARGRAPRPVPWRKLREEALRESE